MAVGGTRTRRHEAGEAVTAAGGASSAVVAGDPTVELAVPTGEGIGVEQECWERALDVGWRRTATGVVLLPTSGTVAYALDGMPARCWEALGRPMTLAALATELELQKEGRNGASNNGMAARAVAGGHAHDEVEVAEVVRFLVTIGVVRACVSSTT